MSLVRFKTRSTIEFVSNISKMISGGVLAQGISLVAAPVVARIFFPSQFGKVALLSSLASMIVPVSTFCYNQAIPLPRSENEANGIAQNCFLILLTLSAAVLFIVLSFILYYPSAKYVASLGSWIFLLPVLVFTMGAARTFHFMNVRSKQFGINASSQVVQNGTTSSTRVAGGIFLGASEWLLFITILLGNSVYLLFLARRNFKKALNASQRLKLRGRLDLAKKFKDFPLYTMPTVIITSLSQNLPILFLGYFFDAAILGFYAFAHRLINLPLNVVSDSIRQVYFQKAAELFNAGRELKYTMVKTTLGLVFIGLLPLVLLIFFSKDFFTLFLGSRWGESGVFAAILAPLMFSRFIAQPSNAVFIVLRRQGLLFKYQFVAIFFKLFSFLHAYYLSFSIYQTLWYFSIVSTVFNLGIIVIALFLIFGRDLYKNI